MAEGIAIVLSVIALCSAIVSLGCLVVLWHRRKIAYEMYWDLQQQRYDEIMERPRQHEQWGVRDDIL